MSKGDMGVCCVDAGHQGDGVCVGWLLISNEEIGVCWVGADQQGRHGCVLRINEDIGLRVSGAGIET